MNFLVNLYLLALMLTPKIMNFPYVYYSKCELKIPYSGLYRTFWNRCLYTSGIVKMTSIVGVWSFEPLSLKIKFANEMFSLSNP